MANNASEGLPGARSGDVISVEPLTSAVVAGATGRLITHEMERQGGGLTLATTVLIVPRGTAPEGGWPVIAWAHGTSTGGQKLRAPSLSPTLDGGLTADGSVTGYIGVFEALIAAGYAIAAPDLEGLGVAARDPHPYFSASSMARSLNSAVLAAHNAERSLSVKWATMGHSEGGHGALAADNYANEAAGLPFVGSIGFAPFTSVSRIVEWHGEQALLNPENALDHVVQQNFNVALIAAGMWAQQPNFELETIMGTDLQSLMSSVVENGSVKIVTDIAGAIEKRGIKGFSGFVSDWHLVEDVSRFLFENDLAEIPGFSVDKPALILQGAHDISVPDPVTSEFVERATSNGASVTYSLYDGADHFSIVQQGLPEAIAFLARAFAD